MFANTTMSSRGCELVETADDHWRLSRAGGGDKPSRFSGLSGLPPPPSAFLIFEKSPPLLAAPSLPAARRLACAGRTALAADAAAMQRLGVRHVTKPLQTSSALSAACTRTFCALGGGLARARKVRPVTSLQALKVSGTGSEMGDEWRQVARAHKRENVPASRRSDLASVGAARARSGKIFPMAQAQCGRSSDFRPSPPLYSQDLLAQRQKPVPCQLVFESAAFERSSTAWEPWRARYP